MKRTAQYVVGLLVAALVAMFTPAIAAGATDATPNPTSSTLITVETAAEPTEVPATCDAPGSWVAPSQEGVTWNTEVAGNVTVFDAVANEGYALGYDFQSHIEKLNAPQLTEGCVVDGGTSPGDKDDDGESPGQGDTTGGGSANTPTGGHAPGGTTPKPTSSAVVVTGTVVLGTD